MDTKQRRRILRGDERLTLGTQGTDRAYRQSYFLKTYNVVRCDWSRARCGHMTILIQKDSGLCFACVVKSRLEKGSP